jgi:hypothetical protein
MDRFSSFKSQITGIKDERAYLHIGFDLRSLFDFHVQESVAIDSDQKRSASRQRCWTDQIIAAPVDCDQLWWYQSCMDRFQTRIGAAKNDRSRTVQCFVERMYQSVASSTCSHFGQSRSTEAARCDPTPTRLLFNLSTISWWTPRLSSLCHGIPCHMYPPSTSGQIFSDNKTCTGFDRWAHCL